MALAPESDGVILCRALRERVKAVASAVGAVRAAPLWSGCGEATANVVLAYRHLEDAAMRLGKAIQALDGGTSVYDRQGPTVIANSGTSVYDRQGPTVIANGGTVTDVDD